MFSIKMTAKVVAGVAASFIFIGTAQAKDFYKMSTISLPTPFAINTTFAQIVQKYNKDIERTITCD